MTSPNPSSPSIASTPSSSRTASPARGSVNSATANSQPPPSSRRPNRAALRDYYGLKAAKTGPTAASTSTSSTSPSPANISTDSTSTTTKDPTQNPNDEPPAAELDLPTFNAQSYVTHLLSTQNLSGLLRVEGALVNEIRSLDGEKKALVYDNYSKLITATETIGRMRRNMDPLTPTTSMLEPAVAHIAKTTQELRERSSVVAAPSVAVVAAAEGNGESGADGETGNDEGSREEKKRQIDTVRWVLGTPRRLGVFLEAGERDRANEDWEEVQGLLGEWVGVGGVEEIRSQCEKVMAKG